ncbi:MAG TPA: PqiC family protein [Acetobacteraceae bacterium]|nr:PqiC family protein [Acetobacteraceae bacterium]
MRGHRLAATTALLLLAACGSTPTRVFDLSPPVPNAPAANAPLRGAPLIWVDKPSVAGYFDRTQMVTRGAGSRVSIHEFEVWSDPPADLIQRAIVDDLAQRFGADRVMATPVARYATPGWRVALDVIRFDVDEGGDAVLDARWTLLAGSSDRLAASRRERIEVPSGDAADPAKRVAALREAVAMLASRIGDAVAAGATPDARRR